MNAIIALRARTLALASRITWLPAVALRLVLGITFVKTGWGKMHSLDQVTAFFTSLGIPFAEVQAPMVAIVELVGGGLLLAGLATRVAAALLTSVMAVAIATAVWPDAADLLAVVGSLEAIYLAALIHLAVHGAGLVSLDHLAARRLPASEGVSP